MRTLVHISDLHFGAVEPRLVDALTRQINGLAPDLVVVSGDLTQRARHREFRAARAFLDALAPPKVVVAGNHDVPLYNVVKRFVYPLTRYRAHITVDLMPIHEDPELLVIGMTSARSFTFAGGRLSRDAVEALRRRLEALAPPPEAMRILVCHHPVDVEAKRGLGGARAKHVALPELGALGFEVLLSGHLHDPATTAGHVLLIAAGTATSVRVRNGEPNSFNVLRIDRPELRVERRDWSDAAGDFVVHSHETYRHEKTGWAAQPGRPIT